MKKRIIIPVILSLVLGIAILIYNTIPVEAGRAAKYASRSPEGDIIITTYDHHSSEKTYKTIGFTVGRCTLGTKHRSPGHEFVTFAFNEAVVEVQTDPDSQGMIITNFIFPESTLMERIATFYGDDWLAELQGVHGEQPVYIVIDSIMCCCALDKTTGKKIQYGYLINDGSRTGAFMGNTYWNIPDSMSCSECSGSFPCLQDGWLDDSQGVSSTPICALHHPNCLDGNDSQFDGV